MFEHATQKVDVRLPGKVNSKLPRREAASLNHHDDIVDSDQEVDNSELSLSVHALPGVRVQPGPSYPGFYMEIIIIFELDPMKSTTQNDFY